MGPGLSSNSLQKSGSASPATSNITILSPASRSSLAENYWSLRTRQPQLDSLEKAWHSASAQEVLMHGGMDFATSHSNPLPASLSTGHQLRLPSFLSSRGSTCPLCPAAPHNQIPGHALCRQKCSVFLSIPLDSFGFCGAKGIPYNLPPTCDLIPEFNDRR